MLSAQDIREFRGFLRQATDRQVQGIYDKEKRAGRDDYAELAVAEAERRDIVLNEIGHSLKKSPCIDVVFRVFPDGDVIALFPGESVGGGHINSYQHVGQHGGASPSLIKELRKATHAEYAPLRAELKRIGYCLRVRA